MACFTSGGRNKLPITSVRYATLVGISLLLLPVSGQRTDRPFDDSIAITSYDSFCPLGLLEADCDTQARRCLHNRERNGLGLGERLDLYPTCSPSDKTKSFPGSPRSPTPSTRTPPHSARGGYRQPMSRASS